MPGNHTLAKLPKDVSDKHAFLKIACEVKRMSARCADVYIQAVNITGSWLRSKMGDDAMTFNAQRGRIQERWMHIGHVQVKVARGATKSGIKYLNMFTKHVGITGLTVGGILGEDDHTTAATPMEDCRRVVDL